MPLLVEGQAHLALAVRRAEALQAPAAEGEPDDVGGLLRRDAVARRQLAVELDVQLLLPLLAARERVRPGRGSPPAGAWPPRPDRTAPPSPRPRAGRRSAWRGRAARTASFPAPRASRPAISGSSPRSVRRTALSSSRWLALVQVDAGHRPLGRSRSCRWSAPCSSSRCGSRLLDPVDDLLPCAPGSAPR